MKKCVFNILLIFSVTTSFIGCSSKEEPITSTQQLIKVPTSDTKEKTQKQASVYEKERKEFLSKTMYNPKIPVKTPDKIIRVLTMPYVDEENNLQTENFHFVKVDEGRWILGEYLTGQDRTENNKTLTPLK